MRSHEFIHEYNEDPNKPVSKVRYYTERSNHYNNPQISINAQLYEGISKSYQPSEVINAIEKVDPDCQIMSFSFDEFGHPARNMDLYFDLPINSNFDRIQQIITTCGWFVSESSIECEKYTTVKYHTVDELLSQIPKLVNPVTLKIRIESRYGYNINGIIKKKFKQVYHLTPTRNVDKILEIGLTPRSQAKINAHPERIYFALTIPGLENLIPKFVELTKQTDWTILAIDCKSFQAPGHHVYTDPEFEGLGAFTMANIPPYCITVVKSFKI